MDMKPLKEKVSITLDPELIITIRKMAEADERNFSQYVNLILREWVRSHADSSESDKGKK